MALLPHGNRFSGLGKICYEFTGHLRVHRAFTSSPGIYEFTGHEDRTIAESPVPAAVACAAGGGADWVGVAGALGTLGVAGALGVAGVAGALGVVGTGAGTGTLITGTVFLNIAYHSFAYPPRT